MSPVRSAVLKVFEAGHKKKNGACIVATPGAGDPVQPVAGGHGNGNRWDWRRPGRRKECSIWVIGCRRSRR